jgi:hypothetical protein
MIKDLLPFSSRTCHTQELFTTMTPLMDMFTPFLGLNNIDIHQLGFPNNQTISRTQPQEMLIVINGMTDIFPN